MDIGSNDWMNKPEIHGSQSDSLISPQRTLVRSQLACFTGWEWGSNWHHVTSGHNFSNRLDLKSQLVQIMMIQEHASIKRERWLQHTVVDAPVVIRLGEGRGGEGGINFSKIAGGA